MKLQFKDNSNVKTKATIKPMSRIPLLKSSLSPKFNNFNQKPVKSNSQDLAFTGFLYKDVKKFNIEDVLSITDTHLGASARELFKSIKKNKLDKEWISISEDGKEIAIAQKTIPHLIYDGLVYPVITLPADLLNGAVGALRRFSPLKNWAEGLYNSEMFNKIRQRSRIDSDINTMRGLFETVGELRKNDPSLESMPKELFVRSVKMFNPKTGKYDTKHERSLNRIVSGSIPAIFLANDAYNLSRMCNDDKTEAKKEKKARFRQELSRVGAQAYLTLITMGAIQKHINNSKIAVMANVGLTALFTESISRLSAGKYIKRLTPEQAQAINAKQNGDSAPEQTSLKIENNYKNVFFKSAEKRHAFASFSGASVPTPPVVEKDSNPKQKAPLLSFNNLFKGIAGAVVVGFALKGLRQNKAFDAFIKKSFEPFNNLYKKLTTDPQTKMSRNDFDTILDRLRKNGFEELADKYVDMEKINRASAISKESGQLLTINPEDINKNLEKLETLGGKPKEEAVSELLKGYNVATAEMTELVNKFKSHGYDKAAENYQKIIDSLNKYQESPEGKKVLAQLGSSNDSKPLVAKNLNELSKLVDGLIQENVDNLHLGPKDKKIAKPVVDFLVGPFKFVWNVLEGPYYWANKFFNAITKQTPKEVKSEINEAKEVKAFITSLDNIGKEIVEGGKLNKNFNAEEFKSFVSDNMLKAFNDNNVSGISNSDLANLAKTSVFAATLPFLMSDNYNIVMLKSNGKDKEGAELKYKERLVQEASRFFYSTLLISLFNNTFQSQYHNSLFGMTWITALCTTISEVINRKSVGVPVGTYTRDQIMEMEKKRENANPLLKGYYDFMSRLTGKKSLSEMQMSKQPKQPKQQTAVTK